MTTHRRITAGAIQDLALGEIIQMISLGRKTARVLVNSPDGSGKIWFDEGRAIHATHCGLRGEEALYKLLEWESGEFVIEHEVTCRRRTINEDTMFMVMESLRRRDEARGPQSLRDGNPQVGGTGRSKAGPWVFRAAMATAAAFVVVTVWLRVDSIDHRKPTKPAVQVDSAELRGSAALKSLERTNAFELPEPQQWIEADARQDPVAEKPTRRSSAMPATDPTEIDPPIGTTADVASMSRKSLAAFHDPLAVPCAPMDVTEPVVRLSFLHLRAHSKVKRGTLLVMANEHEVFRHELALKTRGLKRIFDRVSGSAGENFEQRIPLPAGHQRLVARLIRPNKKDRETAIDLNLDPGDVRPVGLVVGMGSGKPVIWKDETRRRGANGTERQP